MLDRHRDKLRFIFQKAGGSLQYVAYCVRDLFACLRVLRIPVCLCVFASVVLFWPDQTRDYYRLLIENLTDPTISITSARAIFDAVLPIFFLLCMSGCILFSSVLLLAEGNRPDLCRTALVRRVVVFSPLCWGPFRLSPSQLDYRLVQAPSM